MPLLSTTLVAQADAWVNEGSSGSNYGSDDTLYVARVLSQIRPSFNQQALLWFDLRGALPEGAVFTSAQLELNQVDASGAKLYNIWPDALTGPWLGGG